jgi:hypothetical protein
MPGLNHVRKEGAVNVISAGVSKTTLNRLNAHCAKHDAPRSLVIRDFIEFCLDIVEGGETADALKNEIADKALAMTNETIAARKARAGKQ